MTISGCYKFFAGFEQRHGEQQDSQYDQARFVIFATGLLSLCLCAVANRRLNMPFPATFWSAFRDGICVRVPSLKSQRSPSLRESRLFSESLVYSALEWNKQTWLSISSCQTVPSECTHASSAPKPAWLSTKRNGEATWNCRTRFNLLKFCSRTCSRIDN